MNNQEVKEWLCGLSAKSLARVVLFNCQNDKPQQAIEYCKATFWSLGKPCPADVAALATDGEFCDAELSTWNQMPQIELTQSASTPKRD